MKLRTLNIMTAFAIVMNFVIAFHGKFDLFNLIAGFVLLLLMIRVNAYKDLWRDR